MKKFTCVVLSILCIIFLTNCKEKEKNQNYDVAVYVSKYDKIHSYPDCSGMMYYTEMSLSEAISEDYDICQKCEEDIENAIRKYNKNRSGK